VWAEEDERDGRVAKYGEAGPSIAVGGREGVVVFQGVAKRWF